MITSLKKWAIPLIALSLFACQKNVQDKSSQSLSLQNNKLGVAAEMTPCGTPKVATLIDQGGVQTMGTVTISNDATNYYIKVDAASGNVLRRIAYATGTESHVSDAFTLPNFFYTACNGPKTPDKVESFTDLQTAPASFTITIPLSAGDANGCIWIGLVASTTKTDGSNELCGYSDAGSNTVFGSAEYQSGFEYCKQVCPPPPGDCGQLRTQTPGGWGAPPTMNNPGAYLHKNFAKVFPNGVTVGCTPSFYVKITSAQAITDGLPAGGTPAVLTQNYTNPTSIKNSLYHHVLALTLSVNFDAADANFGAAGILLGDMKVKSGTFAGMTVSQVLKIANDVLGGCNTMYKASAVTEVIGAINENYVDGKIDKGFLVCPTR